jgi:hypothetical protein
MARTLLAVSDPRSDAFAGDLRIVARAAGQAFASTDGLGWILVDLEPHRARPEVIEALGPRSFFAANTPGLELWTQYLLQGPSATGLRDAARQATMTAFEAGQDRDTRRLLLALWARLGSVPEAVVRAALASDDAWCRAVGVTLASGALPPDDARAVAAAALEAEDPWIAASGAECPSVRWGAAEVDRVGRLLVDGPRQARARAAAALRARVDLAADSTPGEAPTLDAGAGPDARIRAAAAFRALLDAGG